jgi:hypothetical protein
VLWPTELCRRFSLTERKSITNFETSKIFERFFYDF